MKSMGWIRCALVIVAWSAAACSETENCVVTCAQDTDCPGGQSCTVAGKCSSEDTCPCEPGAFLACTDPSSAAFCTDTGDAVRVADCGAAGCNAESGRCNACVPDVATCADDTVVDHCGSDGLPADSEACVLPCVDDGTGARCSHIVPVWLPEICDADAATPSVTFPVSVTVDTTIDTNCPEIIAQGDGPELCVYHAAEITIDEPITFVGSRAIVFVADHDLTVPAGSAIIANAENKNSGPGGGAEISGGAPTTSAGGGGAGFNLAGGSGGSTTMQAGGQNAGTSVDPTTRAYFAGGPRAAASSSSPTTATVFGGGGGGGVLLVSCRGTVEISGSVSAGGGGGGAGRDVKQAIGTSLVGGGGGGAGGYVVLEGADVQITGSLYANGGAAGGGCGADQCVAHEGDDAKPSIFGATGGNGVDGGGPGGSGAGKSSPAGNGGAGTSPGGGGASTGMFQVYTPAGRTPMITPSTATPDFETPLTVETR